MAWNEPGGGNRDPWGGGGQGGGSPPDLDEVLRKAREKFDRFFGGGSNEQGSGGGSQSSGKGLILLIGAALIGLVFWQGIYILDDRERGIVLRFGQYHSTLMPGFNWQPPLIDTVVTENVTEERQYVPNPNQNLMLTRDENIVAVPMTVQYNIRDLRDYYLNIRDPDLTLEQATDSAIRHVVGSANLDNVISAGRELLRTEVASRLQSYLDSYGAGINIIDVTLQEARPPDAVREAFDDVIAAGADKERLINQADAYRNQILPEARGRAQRAIETAQAYRGELIARAEGEAARFTQLLTEYARAPEVTRERLYIDAIQQIFANTSKVLIDVEGGNNLLYLPLDRLTGSAGGSGLDEESARRILEDALNQMNNSGTTGTTTNSATRTLR